VVEIKDVTATDKSASYLEKGRLRTKAYDFPFLCSNIPTAPAYGVYISQLILYWTACDTSWNTLLRGLLLTRKIPIQGFLLVKLKSSLRTFYSRNHDLIDIYGISVSHMTMDMFDLS